MSDRKRNRQGTFESDVKDLQRRLANRPPTKEEIQEIGKLLSDESHRGAFLQISNATPPDDPKFFADPDRSAMSFYQTFIPSDGSESALARLMVAATNGAMDCFARAATLDSPARSVELNLASKLSLTVAALSRAWDSHRVSNRRKAINDRKK